MLRELDASDCSADYVAWLADPEVNRFLETRYIPQGEREIVAFIEEKRDCPDEFLFGMFLKEGGRHIGNIKVGPIRPIHRYADVSLFVGARDCWARGFAAEAIEAVSRHAFAELDVAKLSASMYAPNEGSRRAFLKAGYREEGRRREHVQFEGRRCDLIELGLVPADLKRGQ